MQDERQGEMTGSIDFDVPVDRRHTDSFKWRRYAGSDILPMWVADMDFVSPPAVVKALHRRVEHGVFGYAAVPDELPELIVERLSRLFGWQILPQWLVWLPGLVSGLNITCRSVGSTGEGVLGITPVYPPFLSAPRHTNRVLQEVPLRLHGNRWHIDFGALQAAITEKSRLLLFCHPHNPVGRVWDEDELRELAAICRRQRLIVCSDEIHCELLLDLDKRHIPFASLNDWTLANSITLMSPSKTFNLAGLGCAFAIIADGKLRRAFRRAMAGFVPEVTITGYTAALAAFRDGDVWLAALIDYLRRNRDLLEKRVARMPHISMTHVEATYLAWIDGRRLRQPSVSHFFENAARIGLSDGADFGTPGFVRLNFGCPAAVLEKALDRMEGALRKVSAPEDP